jgi:hypothetical protein
VRPASTERAKKISPPCVPPENTISCHSMNTCLPWWLPSTLGSHENVLGEPDTFTAWESCGLPLAV